MQRVKLLIAFVVLCLLVSAVPAAAQEITPPPGEPAGEVPEFDPLRDFDPHSFPLPEPTVEEGDVVYDTYEKDAPLEGVTLIEEQPRADLNVNVDDSLVADADPLQPDILGPTHSMPAEEKEGERTRDGEVAPLKVGGRTDVFPIASSAVNEYSSDVAHGVGRYMVVFIDSGDVYARVYTDYGAYQTTFLVANLTYPCSYPTIAYDSSSGLFLVAFEHDFLGDGTDYDVLYTAVSPTVGRVGSLYGDYTSSALHNWYPSVACNANAGSCMLVYAYNQGGSIWGFYLAMNNTGVFDWSPSQYLLSTTTNASHPFLAWGRGTGTYMLTFTYTDGIGDDYPMYAHLFDMPTSPAYVHTSRYVVPSTYFPTGHDKNATGVAFDPCTRKYLITFDYDYSGAGTDWDVWVAVKHETGPYSNGEMSVASSFEQEWGADISFVTDDYRPAACGTMDKLVAVYQSWPDGIRAADIFGNDSVTYPSYYREHFSHHLWVAMCGTSVDCLEVAVAGGWLRGDLFTTFTAWFPGIPDYYDIYGRMLEVADRTYLPLTAK